MSLKQLNDKEIKSLISWTSKTQKIKKLRGTSKHLQGSFTIEAAVIMPIFLMVSVGILLFSRIMILEWGMSCVMDKVVRQAALYGTAVQEETVLDSASLIALLNLYMVENDVPTEYISNGVLGMDYSESEITESEIDLIVHYQVKMPFSLLGGYTWDITQRAKAHRWVGYDPMEDSGENGYVYVTEYGEAYHLDRDCTYLNPSIQEVSRMDLESLRSLDGAKYTACPLCGDDGENTVYITDWGTCYHSDLHCSALKRTIRMIPYSEAVEKYHACDKCGGE